MKVSFIGAGSIGFTQTLVRDLLKVPEFHNTNFFFHDISEKNLVISLDKEKSLRNLDW